MYTSVYARALVCVVGIGLCVFLLRTATGRHARGVPQSFRAVLHQEQAPQDYIQLRGRMDISDPSVLFKADWPGTAVQFAFDASEV
jgi:hypothetical protein